MTKFTHLLAALIILLLCSSIALAERSGPLVGDSDSLLAFAARPTVGNSLSQSAKHPRLSFRHRSIGRVSLTFLSRDFKDWEAFLTQASGAQVADPYDLTLMRGMAEVGRGGRREMVPFGATIEERNGKRRLITFLTLKRGLYRRTVFLRLEARFPERKRDGLRYRLRITPDSIFNGKSCATDAIPKVAEQLNRPPVRAASTLREVELVTYADYEFGQIHGPQSSRTNAEIASIVNAANVIYERDFGIRIVIRGQYTESTALQPYTLVDPSPLLTQFTNYVHSNPPPQSRDNAHLFTGKDLTGSTIGIAYVGVVCYAPSYSTGLTQHVSAAANPLIFAHELGHNFDAAHDSVTQPRTIMAPSLSIAANSFSAITQGQVRAHLADYGACLASVSDDRTPTTTPTPTPTPTSTSTPTPAPEGSVPATPTPSEPPPTTVTPTATPTPSTPTAANYSFGHIKARSLRNRISLQVTLIRDGVIAPGEPVELKRGPITSAAARLTNQRGEARAVVRAPGIYYFTYLTPDGVTIQSGRVRIRRR